MKSIQTLSYNTNSYAHDILRAFENLKPSLKELQSTNKTALLEIQKQTGLERITPESITINQDNKSFTFSSENLFGYRITEQNIDNNKIEKDVFIRRDYIEKSNGFEKESGIIDKFITQVCELLDFPLLQVRKLFRGRGKCSIAGNETTGLKEIGGKCNPAESKATGSKEIISIAEEIKTLFKDIDKNIMSIENVPSRSHVKNGYPNIKTGIRGSKQLEFLNIGKNGENYIINVLTDHDSKTNVVIRINETQNIIIEPDGKVLKSKKINRKCILGDKKEYYSEAEIQSQEMKEHLETVLNELKKYNDFVIQRIQHRNDFKQANSTTEIGTIGPSNEKLITNIQDKYNFLRKAMLGLKEKIEKDNAKKTLNIVTIAGSPSILFKNVGTNQENIHLSFPPLKRKEGMKIIVLDNENKITKSYFIQDSKLLKFNANNTSRSKRSDSKNNYHTQEEINNSKLEDYLNLLNKRLSQIQRIISSDKKWFE